MPDDVQFGYAAMTNRSRPADVRTESRVEFERLIAALEQPDGSHRRLRWRRRLFGAADSGENAAGDCCSQPFVQMAYGAAHGWDLRLNRRIMDISCGSQRL
ncbi:MAG: hypothetical protein P8Y93_01280 [Acidobacteriota bacterium]